MKRYILLYSGLLLSTLMPACKKSLDVKTDSTFGTDFVWTNPDKAQGVLINAYANIPQRFDYYPGNNFLDAATDNAVTNNFSSAIAKLGSGSLSSLDNPVGDWNNIYNQFRNIHLFLENGLTSKVTYDLTSQTNDTAIKNRLKGEAFFLRAYWGFLLLQQYGGKTNTGDALGYPIILKSLSDAQEQNIKITRNTYEECAVQIMADCDTAFKYLPLKYSGSDNVVGVNGLGRADQQCSLALKARVAVYAASPAYQPNSIVQIVGMGQYNIVNSTAYIQKWQRAVTAAQQAITLIGNFSSLKTTDFNSATTPADFIWRRFANNRSMEASQYPPFSYGDAITGPSQNLVESFSMKNGYPITDSRSGYDANNPYNNRDPRLDNTVYYNTGVIDNRNLEIYTGGVDAPPRFANATRTGYYERKWLTNKPSVLSPENPLNDYHYYVMLRKTELYLNFAEASNEAYGPNVIATGSTQSAATVIKNIRKAAGLTAASSDAYVTEVANQGAVAFRKMIQNERRIELAFENHRFFDMRRWLLPLNETVKGVVATKNGTAYTYSVVNVEERKLNNIKYYYLPLPYAELSKSPTLVNNLGW